VEVTPLPLQIATVILFNLRSKPIIHLIDNMKTLIFGGQVPCQSKNVGPQAVSVMNHHISYDACIKARKTDLSQLSSNSAE
jgi:hypothetical protein